MRYALALLVLAGCGAQVGGPCKSSADCDGNVCDLTDPGGAVCIDREGDLDGDGIPNSKDFCNHMPGGEFDEDGDGIGDVCDRCPIAPPPATPDSDTDEVDSPCDPDPTTDGDQIAVFEGFGAGLPAGWTASAGWQFVGGEAIVTPVDSLVTEELTAPLPLISQHIAVLAQYRIDAVDPLATQNFAGTIAIDRRPAGGSTIQCTGRRTGTTDTLVLETDVGSGTKVFPNLFDTASLYRVVTTVDLAMSACAMVADNDTGAVAAATNGEASTAAGFVAKGATARFQYLLVIQR